ncbi:hypothetical protein [Dethiobacter alkaliphilus]|uniref:hypothetical protein n=1 Tax=Dethiobacter alkaliphilus TaxID=427926 RepID=UPI002226B466|nr:hypothetical protein [Dethiobacter alkaliphilus]MCW3489784.1 hypothetical protein [Dethiobacter alkaliphilus]
MKGKPLVRKFFADSNTACGFHSVYNHIPGHPHKKLVILRGTCKSDISALLAEVGEFMFKEGYDLEYFFCSLQPGSIDALTFPALKVSVVDGSAPHLLDTSQFNFLTEEIGVAKMRNKKILSLKYSKSRNDDEAKEAYTAGYYYLAEAQLALKHLTLHKKAIVDTVKINQVVLELLGRILDDEPCRKEGLHRHLLASAITPRGILNYYESIISVCSELYLLTGSLGLGKSGILDTVYQVLRHKGLGLEIYRCALNPDKIDALLVPEKGLAIVKLGQHVPFNTNSSGILYKEYLNLDSSAAAADEWKAEIINDYENRFELLLSQGIKCLKKGYEAQIKKEAHHHQMADSLRFQNVKDEIITKMLS